MLKLIVSLRLRIESGGEAGFTKISSPGKYYGLLWFRDNEVLIGFDYPRERGRNRWKSNLADKFKFSDVLLLFDKRSCKRW